MADIMTLQNIEKFYGDKIRTQVLFGIDLAIEAGSFNSIIGQSGSGKSTLMNIMGTLDQPTSGTVTIDGVETTKMSRKQLAVLRNRTIGFVFQFHYLLPEFTVIENVLMPYRIAHGTDPRDQKRAHELLETVELTRVATTRRPNIRRTAAADRDRPRADQQPQTLLATSRPATSIPTRPKPSTDSCGRSTRHSAPP
jgi:lipoprotein-releasing system ATP-binding protein